MFKSKSGHINTADGLLYTATEAVGENKIASVMCDCDSTRWRNYSLRHPGAEAMKCAPP